MPITLERTPIEKQIYAKTLLDMGASVRTVAHKVGLGNDTILAIRHSQSYSTSMLEEFKKRLPFKAYRLADDVIDCIDSNEIKKAPLNVKMIAFGIAIDKARDMEGSNRPIFNVVTVINECKQTRDKLERQLGFIVDARAA